MLSGSMHLLFDLRFPDERRGYRQADAFTLVKPNTQTGTAQLATLHNINTTYLCKRYRATGNSAPRPAIKSHMVCVQLYTFEAVTARTPRPALVHKRRGGGVHVGGHRQNYVGLRKQRRNRLPCWSPWHARRGQAEETAHMHRGGLGQLAYIALGVQHRTCICQTVGVLRTCHVRSRCRFMLICHGIQ